MRVPSRLPESYSAAQEARAQFTRDVVRTVFVTVLIVAGFGLAAYAANVLLLVFAGILLAVFLRGLSGRLSFYTGLSSGWALAAVIATLVAVAVIASLLLAPEVAAQLDQLARRVPESANQLEERLMGYQWGRVLVEHSPSIDQMRQGRLNLLGRFASFFSTTLGFVVDLLIVLFIGLYLAVQPSIYRSGLVRLFPIRERATADQIMGEMATTLERWLIGRIIGMLVVAVATAVGLWLLGAPLALSLGILAGVLVFIPNFGPVLSAIPAVLVALPHSSELAVYVVLLYLGIQLVESYALTPLIQQRAVSLPPALIITMQALMGVLLGGLALVLATPLTAIAMVAVKRLYIERALGESPVISDDEGSGINAP